MHYNIVAQSVKQYWDLPGGSKMANPNNALVPFTPIPRQNMQQRSVQMINITMHPSLDVTIDIQLVRTAIQLQVYGNRGLSAVYQFNFGVNAPVRINIVNAVSGELIGQFVPQ